MKTFTSLYLHYQRVPNSSSNSSFVDNENNYKMTSSSAAGESLPARRFDGLAALKDFQSEVKALFVAAIPFLSDVREGAKKRYVKGLFMDEHGCSVHFIVFNPDHFDVVSKAFKRRTMLKIKKAVRRRGRFPCKKTVNSGKL